MNSQKTNINLKKIDKLSFLIRFHLFILTKIVCLLSVRSYILIKIQKKGYEYGEH